MTTECLPRFPFSPLQAEMSVGFGSGILSTGLSGGPSLRRLDTVGNVHSVSVSWRLNANDYSMFMGYVRNFERSGGDPFLIALRLESADLEDYQAYFVPGSVSKPTREAGVFSVSAQLEVMPKFVSPCSDEWASRAALNAFYGDEACEVMDILSKVVNEDLVYVRS